jgi:uncharacterized membrane protein YjdF
VATVARAHPALAGFTMSYLAGFATVGLGIRSDLAVSYAVVVSVMVVVVCRLEDRFHLGPGVLWAFSIWGVAHMAGGIVPLGVDPAGRGRILYNAWLVPHVVRYDQAVHAFGFGYATVVCGKVLRTWLPVAPATRGPAVLAALAGMGVGAMNEVVEFLSTLVLTETHVGGFENTGWDLVFDLLGATVAAVWLAASWAGSRERQSTVWLEGSRVTGAAQGTRCEPGAVPQL